MANSSISLTSLDFADYKNSLKTFLSSQNQFKDYNFESSNLNVLLDLLAYNTYQNAFYMNMIGSEMFLDTAQLRDSVVLKAVELNYTPRSFRSSYAKVNLAISGVPNNPLLLTIPAGTSFTGKAGSNTYTFSTNQNLVVEASGNGVFNASNVEIYEGTPVTDTFVIKPSATVDNQQFILSNPTIDTESLTVVSIENGGANVIPYLLSTTLLDIKETTPVYFLQGSDNSQYQIIFGDNVVGRKPLDNSVVSVSYLVTNGQLPNGISIFSPNSTIGGGTANVATVSAATGGDIAENIESIRFNAPRHYATQERAVTTTDYETLLQVTYPEIQALSVYGGETTTPPQYGKVIVSMKLSNFDIVPSYKINEYTEFLRVRAPLTITPVFIEPEYTYASVTTNVKYNVNQTTLQPADISAYVTTAIQNYSRDNLEDFKSTLLYSKLVYAIDNAQSTIISNETDYTVMKKLIPSMQGKKNYQLNFKMAINSNLPPAVANHESRDEHAVQTSKFIYNGLLVNIEDDGNGNLRIVQEQSDGLHRTLVDTGVGNVNYETGTINITNFYTSSYFGDSIRVYIMPRNKDNSTNENVIFEIPNDEIKVSVQIVRQ